MIEVEGLYHGGPGRKYRPTRKEMETKSYLCPRCKSNLQKKNYKLKGKLYQCSTCGFSIRSEDIIDPKAPESPSILKPSPTAGNVAAAVRSKSDSRTKKVHREIHPVLYVTDGLPGSIIMSREEMGTGYNGRNFEGEEDTGEVPDDMVPVEAQDSMDFLLQQAKQKAQSGSLSKADYTTLVGKLPKGQEFAFAQLLMESGITLSAKHARVAKMQSGHVLAYFDGTPELMSVAGFESQLRKAGLSESDIETWSNKLILGKTLFLGQSPAEVDQMFQDLEANDYYRADANKLRDTILFYMRISAEEDFDQVTPLVFRQVEERLKDAGVTFNPDFESFLGGGGQPVFAEKEAQSIPILDKVEQEFGDVSDKSVKQYISQNPNIPEEERQTLVNWMEDEDGKEFSGYYSEKKKETWGTMDELEAAVMGFDLKQEGNSLTFWFSGAESTGATDSVMPRTTLSDFIVQEFGEEAKSWPIKLITVSQEDGSTVERELSSAGFSKVTLDVQTLSIPPKLEAAMKNLGVLDLDAQGQIVRAYESGNLRDFMSTVEMASTFNTEKMQGVLREKSLDGKQAIEYLVSQFASPSGADRFRHTSRDAVIKQEGDEWCLYSHDGKKNLGCGPTEEWAKKREQQVSFFKSQGMSDDDIVAAFEEEEVLAQLERQQQGPGGTCRCTQCGYEIEHETGVPCMEESCPQCGEDMIREADWVAQGKQGQSNVDQEEFTGMEEGLSVLPGADDDIQPGEDAECLPRLVVEFSLDSVMKESQMYQKGDRVQSLESGDVGTVAHVGQGVLSVNWDAGKDFDQIEAFKVEKVPHTPMEAHLIQRMAKIAGFSKTAQIVEKCEGPDCEDVEEGTPEFKSSIDYLLSSLKQDAEHANAYLTNSEKLTQIAKDFLGVEKGTQLTTVKQDWSPYMADLLRWASAHVFKAEDLKSVEYLDTHKYGEDVSSKLEDEESTIQIALERSALVPVSGIRFFEVVKPQDPSKVAEKESTGVRMIVSFSYEPCPYNPPEVRVQVKKGDRAIAERFIGSLVSFIHANNFYKGNVLQFDKGQLGFIENPQVFRKDVILLADVEKSLWDNSVEMIARKKVFAKYPEGCRRSVLLYGPPGTGKTQVFRAISNQLGNGVSETTVIWTTGRSVDRPAHVAALFDAARDLAGEEGSVILFEDIDIIGSERDWVLGEMLTQMSGSDPNRNIVIMASTNEPELLDPALSNRPERFDRRFEIGLPNKDFRWTMLRRFLGMYDFDHELLDGKGEKRLAEQTEGFTGAHLKDVVKTMLIKTQGKEKKASSDILMAAIKEVRDNFTSEGIGGIDTPKKETVQKTTRKL